MNVSSQALSYAAGILAHGVRGNCFACIQKEEACRRQSMIVTLGLVRRDSIRVREIPVREPG